MEHDWNIEELEGQDPRRFTCDAAYTAPAEEARRKRQDRKRVILGTVLALLVLLLLCGVFYLGLSGILDEEERGLSRLFGTRVQLSSTEGETALVPAENSVSREAAVPDEAAPRSVDTHIDLEPSSRRGERLGAEELYEKCAPSVVSVVCFDGTGEMCGFGSGVILTEDGSLLTNAHLLQGASTVTVYLSDGTSHSAAHVGSDSVSGLAVLRVEAEGLQEAEFADLSSVETGSAVIAIGSALPGSLSVTDGLVAAKEAPVRLDGYSLTALETTAYGGAGCSGGAVFNAFGQVIGILNAPLTDRYDLGRIALALPMSVVKPVVEELLEKGYVSGQPSTGLQLSDIPLSAAAFYGLPSGVFVEGVFTGADAYEKGISRGDIIVSANGKEIGSLEELNAVLDQLSVGDTVTLGVYRSRELYQIEITLIDLNAMMHE